jgi:hypothetical protein
MIKEKNGSWRPTMAERCCTSIPVTAERAIMGVPNAPKATGAVFAMSDTRNFHPQFVGLLAPVADIVGEFLFDILEEHSFPKHQIDFF